MLCGLALASSSSAADSRTAFLKLIERPRVELAVETAAPQKHDGQVRIDFSYAVQPGERVPGILLKAENTSGRRPVVIALHGTGGGKESQLAFMSDLVRAGFIAV